MSNAKNTIDLTNTSCLKIVSCSLPNKDSACIYKNPISSKQIMRRGRLHGFFWGSMTFLAYAKYVLTF